ncbi:unnamed protein product [Vitrella brassicaformis CCMP3155]|uniref:F-actin-capping protein subunit beta n=2 Tax=Vitrella brassicaformis TaxID=1169539 RepID=A0A0G4FXH2_VITBC|nr:unnamed protein product [Vitrella brassicaformis CCMP3155]|eukprot:CEM19698.1 unnamed protein product [Vitrella brassicaformis CCMP3155]
MTSALNLGRRLPPQNVEKTVIGLVRMVPSLAEELLQRIDRPLKVKLDTDQQMYFVASDYNREGNSFRSPWSNQYYPPLPDADKAEAFYPSEHMRKQEVLFNEVFDAYRHSYFGGGVSSVYLWDLSDDGFAAAFFVHKESDKGDGDSTGTWDSIHVAEVVEAQNAAHYKVTSTVILSISDTGPGSNFRIGGQMTRQTEEHLKMDEAGFVSHLTRLGPMLEGAEARLRKDIDQVYVHRTRECVNGLRSLQPNAPPQAKATRGKHMTELATVLAAQSKKKTADQ